MQLLSLSKRTLLSILLLSSTVAATARNIHIDSPDNGDSLTSPLPPREELGVAHSSFSPTPRGRQEEGTGRAGEAGEVGGFLTAPLNAYLARRASASLVTPLPQREGQGEGLDTLQPSYGRKLDKYFTIPKFSGYVVGKFGYTSRESASPSSSFEMRLVRFTVEGTLLSDFYYRVHLELKGGTPLRDAYLEWRRLPWLQVRVGQFKRCFTFENTFTPWNTGFGGYSQLLQHMTAMTGPGLCGEPAQNGRDIGIMLQGDLLPVGKDRHRLLRYQAAVYNGNGQNNKDNNSKKDYMGSFQLQPLKGLRLGVYGWTGTYTGANGVTVERNRWSVGANYEYRDWTFRAEYAHHSGYDCTKYDAKTGTFLGSHEADAWLATVGAPCTPWLKVWLRYDAFRPKATWGSLRTVYSLCPNFDLHKNLKFQLQYNYVHDRSLPSSSQNFHELWTEVYVQF